MNKTLTLFFLFLLAGSLTACVGPRNPEDHAQWFFGKGEKLIVKSLEKQDVPEAKVDEARKVINQHRSGVIKQLSSYIRSEHTLLEAIVGGKSADELMEKENALHQQHIAALNAIGKMHEELAGTVGKEKWMAASVQRQEKFKRHME